MAVGASRAERLVAAAGIGASVKRRRSDRVVLLCPFHNERRPSAAVLDTGVLVCSSGCGSFSPFDWLTRLGMPAGAAMELLVDAGLREDRRPELNRGPSHVQAAPPVPAAAVAPAVRPELPASVAASLGDAAERLQASPATLARLHELRAFSPHVLAGAGVGLAAARDLGRFAAALADAAAELRLTVPLRDDAGRLVGALAVAPGPKRHEPKVLAVAGSSRVPLVLASSGGTAGGPLLVTEGELDALAAASCGLPAVGVPGVGGAAGHARLVAGLVRSGGFSSALVVPDADDAGRTAGRALAAAIADAGVAAVLADVLAAGDDVGAYLVRACLSSAGAPAERRHAAGASLRSLIQSMTNEPTP